jgi:hypothetical protein
MRKITTLFFVSLILMFISVEVSAQDVNDSNQDLNKPIIYNWELAAKGGASLLWGDAASSYNPFSRWFSSEGAFTGEIMIYRRLNKFLGLQAGFAKGVFSGYRTEWTPVDVPHPVATSKTDYIDYHLDVNIDFTGLFGFKPDRFLTVYAFGGVGMINYDATSYLDGKLYKTASDKTLMIPWGGGLKFRISERFSILVEASFRNTFVDDVDAYIGQGTDVNDIYSITGLGLTYKFGKKKEKKQKIEIVPVEPVDTSLAQTEEQTPVWTDVVVATGMPVTAQNDTTYDVKVEIKKDSLNGSGTYRQEIPVGFTVTETNSAGGNFSFNDQVLEIKWDKLPDAATLAFNYTLATGKLEPKTYSFEGSFTYDEDTTVRVKTFVDNVTIKLSQEELLAQQSKEKEEQEAVQTEISGIDYRVQVAAVFGGKSDPDVLAKKLKINEEVFEDPYKSGYRYTVGHFDNYGAAKEHRKSVPVNGAYVIVFVDGKYVGEPVKTNSMIMDKDPMNPSGDTYRIQIAASNGRPYSIAKLAYKYGLKESDIYEYKSGNWYLYSVGKFSSKEEAADKLAELKAKVKGAHLIKFNNGRRVK